MEIKRAIEFEENIRDKITELYVEGFFEDGWKFFSKDKIKLKRAFAPLFELEYFYVAVIDNEIAGMIACMNKDKFCLNINIKIFVKYLGIFGGLLAYFGNKNFLSKFQNETETKLAIPEFLVTDEKFRKRGVASSLMKYLLALPEYEHYVIDVADTNTASLNLCQKLGYKEVSRKKFMPRSGINYWIRLKYSKENDRDKNAST